MSRVVERSIAPLLKAPGGTSGWLVDSKPSCWESGSRLETLRSEIQSRCGVDPLEARFDLVRLAESYTSGYRNAQSNIDAANVSIVLAGHQPQWFHPGVWFKNAVLDGLARARNGVAINLVVDNDLCTSTAIRLPCGDLNSPHWESLSLDAASAAVPWEERRIESRELLESAEQRFETLRPHWLKDPLLPQLQEAWKTSEYEPERLGELLAMARHRIEERWGWQTLELPLSRIEETVSFRRFASHLWSDAARLISVYNDSLHEHRKLYRIRSRSHPVPDLEIDGDWIESPFWVWSKQSPNRKRLFVRCSGNSLSLTDRSGWEWHGHVSDWSQAETSPVGSEIRIRSRALTTTWFARAVLSDTFVHGLGGAHYDRLTDQIVSRFWDWELPEFVTATATIRLPVAPEQPTLQQRGNLLHRLRALEFSPETALDENPLALSSSEVGAALDTKRRWIDRSRQGELSYDEKLERHAQVTAANESLARLASDERERVRSELEAWEHQSRRFRILGSREFSLAIHSGDRLKTEFASMLQQAMNARVVT